MISITKATELRTEFDNMQSSQIRLVALLALERMWLPFVGNLRTEYEELLKEQVRLCLDMIWEKSIQSHAEVEHKEQYKNILNIINSTAEYNTEEEFSAPYPLYLINQLFSGIYSVNDSQIADVCSSVAVSALDMICDDVLELNGHLDEKAVYEHIAIINECKRIDYDVTLCKQFPEQISQITAIREDYKNLRIVPVAKNVEQ